MLVLPKSNVVSQAVEGKVVDSVTGEPVSGARVLKEDLPETATYTNRNGEFRVRMVTSLHVRVMDPANENIYPRPRGSSTFLEISCEGYETQRFDIFGLGSSRDERKARKVGVIRMVPK